MQKFLPNATIAFVLFLLFSCSKEEAGSCFQSNGKVVKETRVLAGFDSIWLDRRLTLILVPDTLNYAEVESGEHLLGLIETRQSGKTIYLKNNNSCNWLRSYDIPVNIFLHHTGLRHIYNKGTGKICSTDTLKSDTITLEFKDASTEVNLLIKNKKLEIIQHTGASDVIIAGSTNELAVYMASLGWGDYRSLWAKRVYVENKSATDCYVSAKEEYKFKIKAAGNIFYRPSAPFQMLEYSGSGGLIQLSD